MHKDHSGKSKVVLRSLAQRPVADAVRECMEACGWEKAVPRGARVAVKPNLCTTVEEKLEMSNTDPRITEAVCEVLVERAGHVSVVESDSLRQTADEAFELSGYPAFARRLGVELVNLTRSPWRKVASDPVPMELPEVLLDADVFVTLPVLKTHALTYFTGALKNQWGCVPRHDRILLHRHINGLLVSLQRLLRPALAVMDGIVAMEGRGPVSGLPRRLDLLLAGRDAVALDAAAMRLVGLEPERARHVVMAASAGLGKVAADEIELDGEWERFACRFIPAAMDPALAAMDYMSRYRWFVRHALERDTIFYPVRAVVQVLRRAGIVREYERPGNLAGQ